jgi:probable rRNA maturation factor
LVILQKKVAGLSPQALNRFVARARQLAKVHGTVNLLVTGSASVRALNRQFRGKDKATDVLSFPSFAPVRRMPGKRIAAGDVAISADIARENARRLGHSAAEEIKILTLHGILHLAGFDHERDNGQMARKEANLRRTLGLPVALIERARPIARSQRRKTRARSMA